MTLYVVKNNKAGTDFNPQELLADIKQSAAQEVIDVSFDELDSIPSGSRIIAAGGDGTLSFVAAYAVAHDCELAIIPLGTGNDFARSQALDLSIAECIKIATTSENIKDIDAGYINDTLFLNQVSIGISTAANEAASGKVKDTLGAPAYAVGAVIAAVKENPIKLQVIANKKAVWDDELWQLTIANTGSFGGGASFGSDCHDGKLEYFIFEPTTKLDFFKRAWGLLFSDIKEQDGVVKSLAKEITVKFDGKLSVNIDGDIKDLSSPIIFTIKPSVLKLVVV